MNAMLNWITSDRSQLLSVSQYLIVVMYPDIFAIEELQGYEECPDLLALQSPDPVMYTIWNFCSEIECQVLNGLLS